MLCVEQLAQQDRSSISVEPQHTPTSGEESEWKVFGCVGCRREVGAARIRGATQVGDVVRPWDIRNGSSVVLALIDQNGGLVALQGRIARNCQKTAYMQTCGGTSLADAKLKLEKGLSVLGVALRDSFETISKCDPYDLDTATVSRQHKKLDSGRKKIRVRLRAHAQAQAC